jgi:formylglycine-generating enzyme required for sulfatase activity
VSTVEIDLKEDVAVRTRVPVHMVRIPGGTFRLEADSHYADEAPAHRVTVDAFGFRWVVRQTEASR